ncbi:MAG: hypothetical protein KJN70_16025 [Eudoraea sp.]|nr:hypothetical protein [Eudoraea sp.]
MINFFRKIRKQLADDNHFFKYSRYAIGEILLVVIGILIALQINNWNEDRKLKQFEYRILKDIETSMERNFNQLDRCLSANKKAIISADLILKHLDENLPYNDSLDFHFSRAFEWCSPVFNNAGYESLKTYGTNLVTNETIRQELGIYDSGWMETLAQRQEEYFFNTASPVLTELFEIVAMRTQMKPFDYEQLGKSNKFISILKTSKENRKEQIRWYEQWQQSFVSLDNMIKTELKKQ